MRGSVILSSLALSCAILTATSAGAQFIQPIPGTTTADALAAAMRRLGANPRDLDALITAGELSIRVGDASGAAALFRRAEQISPMNGRVKAGMASILVRAERPGEALRYFNQAEGYGLDPRRFAADRGLAYDLIGEQERAQRDYRLALESNRDDETIRRYALSLGIAGKQGAALEQIDILLRKSDRGAWRARACILAMNGDVAGAERIAATMIPGMARGLRPFFTRLSSLNATDRAFAVHFGEVRPTAARLADARLTPALTPLAPEPRAAPMLVAAQPIAAAPERKRKGKRARKRRGVLDRVEIAASAPRVAVSPSPSPAGASRTDSGQVSPGVRTTTPSTVTATPPVVLSGRGGPPEVQRRIAAVPIQRNEMLSAMTTRQRTTGRAASTPRVVVSRPAFKSPSTAAAARSAPTLVAMTSVNLSAGRVPSPPVLLPPAPDILAPTLSVAAAAAPGRDSRAMPASASTPPPPSLPTISEDTILSRIVSGVSTSADKPSADAAAAPPASAQARPPVNPVATPRQEADAREALAAKKAEDDRKALATKKAADAKALAAKKARDAKALAAKKVADDKALTVKKAADEKALAAKKAAADTKKAEKADPARIWVQVAGGANEGDLPKAWAAAKAKAPALAGRQAWSTPLRATNRVVTGPFKTDAEARAFVNKLAKQGVSAFTFTSAAGQKITRLAAK